MFSIRFVLLAAVVALAPAHGQEARRSFNPFARRPPATVLPATPVTRPGEAAARAETGAVLRTGDTFEMRMSGMPLEDAQTFNLPYTISSDGFINVPLIGRMRAAGLSQDLLQTQIEQRLIQEKIFTRPTASISMAAQGRYVTVGGNVRAPQRLVWSPDLSLTSAINAVGGAGDFGGDKVVLIRGGASNLYSLKKLAKTPGDDPRLIPGDQLNLR